MNSKNVLVMVGAVAVGLWSPIAAMADPVNEYFSTPMTQSLDVTTSSPVIIDRNCSAPVLIDRNCSAPVLIENSAPVLIDRTFSSPVMLEKTGVAPVLLEDRIIKQKHFFGVGIWPLFDFEVM